MTQKNVNNQNRNGNTINYRAILFYAVGIMAVITSVCCIRLIYIFSQHYTQTQQNDVALYITLPLLIFADIQQIACLIITYLLGYQIIHTIIGGAYKAMIAFRNRSNFAFMWFIISVCIIGIVIDLCLTFFGVLVNVLPILCFVSMYKDNKQYLPWNKK